MSDGSNVIFEVSQITVIFTLCVAFFTNEIFTSTGTTACHDSADYQTLYDSESLERELAKKYRVGGSTSKWQRRRVLSQSEHSTLGCQPCVLIALSFSFGAAKDLEGALRLLSAVVSKFWVKSTLLSRRNPSALIFSAEIFKTIKLFSP